MWKKKQNRIFKRLETLFRYFKAYEISDESIHIIEKISDLVHFNFNTKQGPVEIVLTLWDYGEIEYSLSYTTYAGIQLFCVKTSEKSVDVIPCMGYSYNLDAKDIDLAILELEQHLQYVYGDINDRWEQYLLEEQLAWESHEQQLKELL